MIYDITTRYTPEFLRESTNLEELLEDAQKLHLDLRTDKAQQFGHTAKPHLFSKIKKDIARVKTILRERGSNG